MSRRAPPGRPSGAGRGGGGREGGGGFRRGRTNSMVKIRSAQFDDVPACAALADELIGPRRAQPLPHAALARRQLLVASDDGSVVGCLAYTTNWFNCTFVSLVVVEPDHRRKGIARELYRAVGAESASPT